MCLAERSRRRLETARSVAAAAVVLIVVAVERVLRLSGTQGPGHRDYTLVVIPKPNHAMLEAKVGSNAEVKSLERFAPSYFTKIEDWLAKHVRGFTKQPLLVANSQLCCRQQRKVLAFLDSFH
jgi:hypothetical protein